MKMLNYSCTTLYTVCVGGGEQIQYVKENTRAYIKQYVLLEQKKTVLSRWGIFVAIDNNTSYGSKLSIFFYAKNH